MKRRFFLKALGLAGAAVASRKALSKSSEPVAPALDDGLNIESVLAEPLRDRYWVANASSDWNDPANWSASSGGKPGAPVPGEDDNAIFDERGPGDCICNTSYKVKNFVMKPGYKGSFQATKDGQYAWEVLENCEIG